MCHHTAFKTSCLKGVTEHKCQKWMQLVGKDPQTGQDVNRYGCADSFLPLLLIENSQRQVQTAASIDVFRDSMIGLNRDTMRAIKNG